MSDVLVNLGIVVVFIVVGGFFSAAELAIVSLRAGQLENLTAANPRAGARLARLTADPNRFLAAVQVGVTLAGFLSAGFGASQIAPQVTPWLISLGLPQGAADPLAFVLVTVFIAYLSLVLGELAPKRLALQRTEAIASRTSGAIDWLARISRPFIWLLSQSTNVVVRALGGDPKADREQITEDELRGLVRSHEDLTKDERALIDEVFDAGDRELREVMIPRTEVAFLDDDLPLFQAAELVGRKPHSRYPVMGDSVDDIVGFVHVRDILDPALAGRSIRVGSLARDVPRLPGSKRVIPALMELRDSGYHLAIVVDEYGGTDGIVTMEDLVEELVGDIRDEYDEPEPPGHGNGRLAGPVQLDGLTNLDDFADETGVTLAEGPYETVAGFVVHRLGRLARPDDTVVTDGCTITVLSLDGRRIDRVQVDPSTP